MPLKDTTLTHPGSSDCQSYAPTEQWVGLAMSGTSTRAASVCTPTRQWAGLSMLGSGSGQESICCGYTGLSATPERNSPGL